MKSLIQSMRYGWDAARWIRLVLGLAILLPALFRADVLAITLGLLVTALPLLGFSCCGGGACEIDHPSKDQKSFINEQERNNFESKDGQARQ